jgi:hypothetical protein
MRAARASSIEQFGLPRDEVAREDHHGHFLRDFTSLVQLSLPHSKPERNEGPWQMSARRSYDALCKTILEQSGASRKQLQSPTACSDQ